MSGHPLMSSQQLPATLSNDYVFNENFLLIQYWKIYLQHHKEYLDCFMPSTESGQHSKDVRQRRFADHFFPTVILYISVDNNTQLSQRSINEMVETGQVTIAGDRWVEGRFTQITIISFKKEASMVFSVKP